MLAHSVVSAALENGVTITTAESCTGGLVAAAITDIPGSSGVFEYGFVTYSNSAKTKLLGVPPALLDEFGAVSEPVVRAMAEGAMDASGADIAISISGIAGPGGSDFKPEGRVCFALATAQTTQCCTVEFGPLGRETVRKSAMHTALQLLSDILQAE